ncbi:hypothetical protein HDV00_000006 [Rhizophlyctis rosea]|nr:hypothetical protein HDV00_000006 [Rhizophlyctis rosea]
MRAHLTILSLFLLGSARVQPGEAAVSVRGVGQHDLHLYEPKNGKFRCLNGSKEIPSAAVNDDYCDCDDGSDEPGTAACPNGKFHCANDGHESSFILSSRVNDGICDPECCDGTDEYDGKIKCADVCETVGAEHRKQRDEALKIRRQGARKKQEYIALAEQAKMHREGEIRRLETEIESLKSNHESLKAQKEEAEKLQQELQDAELATADSETCERHSSGVRGWLERMLESVSLLKSSSCKDDAVAKVVSTYEEILKEQERPAAPVSEHDLTAVTGVNELQTKFQKIDDEKRDLENKLEEVKKKVTRDYGPDDEFEPLDGRCFSGDATEYAPCCFCVTLGKIKADTLDRYTYEMCFYGAAHQKSKASQLATHLGNWEGWSGSPNKYSEIKFTGGTHCWNGPARSLTVTLECGVEEEVLSVSEPNKCEYAMRLKTPAACDVAVLKEKAKAQKAESEKGTGGMHDEL